MRLLVAGGRNLSINCTGLVFLDKLHEEYNFTELVNGMATGIDKCARRWAFLKGIKVANFPADWKKLGKSAGPRRNEQMLDYMDTDDIVVVFSGGSGSQHMLKISLQSKFVKVIDLMDRKDLIL